MAAARALNLNDTRKRCTFRERTAVETTAVQVAKDSGARTL